MKFTRSQNQFILFIQKHQYFLLLCSVIFIAALFRFWNLAGLPAGVHGDEGIVGYEARRILQQGSIGPFSPASFGQPSGPIYFCALSEIIFGESIFAIRFVSALAGTLTVLAIYGLMRVEVGKKVALAGAFILATLCWNIHYARIAFPLECWPLVCVLIAWATLYAIKNQNWISWALAGFMNGLGVYAYKAHPLFFLITAGFAAFHLVRATISWPSKAYFLGIYGLFALIAANFLIRYALVPEHNYNGHFALFSVFNQSPYLELTSLWAKTLYLAGRYFDWWVMAVFSPRLDAGDGAGIVPLISLPIFGLFIISFFVRKQNFTPAQWNLICLSRLIVALMPIATVITTDAFARRTFALAPFFCVLSAIGVLQIVRWGQKKRMGRALAPALVAVLLVFGTLQTWRDYFFTFAQSEMQRWVFCDELTESLAYMKELPPQTPIAFYSGRWSIDYDTRKFLAPNLNAVDCSKEFSPSKSLVFPTPNPTKKMAWVFLKPYIGELAQVKKQFPNGEIIWGPYSPTSGDPLFAAYEIN